LRLVATRVLLALSATAVFVPPFVMRSFMGPNNGPVLQAVLWWLGACALGVATYLGVHEQLSRTPELQP